jgi:hypothetical protein
LADHRLLLTDTYGGFYHFLAGTYVQMQAFQPVPSQLPCLIHFQSTTPLLTPERSEITMLSVLTKSGLLDTAPSSLQLIAIGCLAPPTSSPSLSSSSSSLAVLFLLPLRSVFPKPIRRAWSVPYIFPLICLPGATILPALSDCCQNTQGNVALNRSGHLSDISALPNFQSLRALAILSQNHSTLDTESVVK